MSTLDGTPSLFATASWSESRHGSRAAAYSTVLHAAAAAALFTLVGSVTQTGSLKRITRAGDLDIGRYVVRLTAVTPKRGGGSGGDRSPLPPNRGQAPPFSHRQYTPPLAHLNPEAKLVIAPTLIGDPSVRLPEVNLPDWGDPSAKAGPPSGGPGSGGGFGTKKGTGIGDGLGPGFGDEEGGFATAQARRGPRTQIVVLRSVEPEYSDEARKVKLTGTVTVKLIVDEHGVPRDFKVVKPLGLGLDEAALQAVAQWRFRPATRGGQAIASTAFIEVSFRLL